MFGNTVMMQQAMANDPRSSAMDSTQLRRQAAQQYWNGRFAAAWHNFTAAITGRSNRLQSLSDVSEHTTQRRYAGVHAVAIDQIRGSEGRTDDFDAQFRPLRSHNMDRWIGVAAAWMRGVSLPPVDLVQVGDSYFVRDGHHRISVARMAGQATIDAAVTVWQR